MIIPLLLRVRGFIVTNALARELLHSSFWAVAGSAASQGLTFLASIVVARVLGAQGYGRLGIVVSTSLAFATFAAMGLGVTATKHVAEYRVRNPERAGRMIGLALIVSALGGLIIALFILVFAPFLSSRVLGAPDLQTEIRLSSFMIVMSAVNGGQLGAISGFKAFKTLAIAGLGRALLAQPVLILCAVTFGIRGAVIGYCIAGLIDFVIYQRVLRSACKTNRVIISYHLTPDDLHVFVAFSLPVLIAGLSFTPAAWAANALLANRSGYVQVGIFTAAFQWQTIILFLSNAVSQIGLPTLAGIQAENPGKYLKCFGAMTFLTSGPAVIVGAVVMFLSRQIMHLYGSDYRQGAACLSVICLSAVLTALNTSAGYAIWSVNAAVAGMLFALLRGVALIATAYLLTPYGALGLAAAFACTALIQTAAVAPYLYIVFKRELRSAATYSASAPGQIAAFDNLEIVCSQPGNNCV